jgi:hypothetical protein
MSPSRPTYRAASAIVFAAVSLSAAACSTDAPLAPAREDLIAAATTPSMELDGTTTALGTGPYPATGAATPTTAAAFPNPVRTYVTTTYPAQTGRVLRVYANGNLQRAIDTARAGDVIQLQPGATFRGNFVLRAKPAGAGWIVIRTATPDAQLPAPGGRMSPAYAPKLARITTPNAMAALRTAPGAHHYRLVGLEITADPTVARNYGLVLLGDVGPTQDALSEVPSFLVLDRTYVHGHGALAVSRCIALNSASSAVIDSWITECHSDLQDSQAIGGWNGPGPYQITNNRLEGAGEVVMFGGADPTIAGMIPSDIEFRRNHVTRPASWKTGRWYVKNLFELKAAQRVLVSANVFENNWVDGQNGFAILFQSMNQGGKCTWCTVRDVSFVYNRIRQSAGGVNIIGVGVTPYATVPGARYYFAHNLFTEINTTFGGNGRIWQVGAAGLTDVTIRHNTAMNSTTYIALALTASGITRLQFLDNLMLHGNYGVFGDARGTGIPGLVLAPQAYVAGNVLIGGVPSLYPSGNYVPPREANVGFATGTYLSTTGEDYRLGPSSPYRGRASDGTDPGVNMASLYAMTADVAK